MAKTMIADIIIPNVFEQYALERTAAKSAFVQSGIVELNPQFDQLAAGGGKTVDMPFWQDITPARQILADNATLAVNKITASKDVAIINNDAQAWGANDLAGALAGSDPLNALLELVGAYWSRTDQAYVISVLKGLFGTGGTLATTHKLAIGVEATGSYSASTKLNGDTFVDATVKLGDCSDNLTALAVHSAVEASLRKLDLIDYLPDSEGKMTIKVFQGRRVIIDDSIPVRAGTTSGYVYTSYLFGPGCFARGNASLNEPVEGGNGTKAVEWSRVALDSDTNFINRRRYLLHPRGVKFNSASLAGTSPTNAELETVGNWTRVFEAKNVRMVAIDHNI
jgi:hypothetical protein